LLIHAVRQAKLGTNLQKYPARPINCRTCLTLPGEGTLVNATT
jgi:hypothetical protein